MEDLQEFERSEILEESGFKIPTLSIGTPCGYAGRQRRCDSLASINDTYLLPKIILFDQFT